jgi:hypothetical protein
VTDNIDQELLRTTEKGSFDLLLIGAGKPLFRIRLGEWLSGIKNSILRKSSIWNYWGILHFKSNKRLIHSKARYIMENAKCNVGVFIDRKFDKGDRIFLPLLHRDDKAMVPYLVQFLNNKGTRAFIFDKTDIFSEDDIMTEVNSSDKRFHMLNREEIEKNGFFSEINLVLISVKSWKYLIRNYKGWIQKIPSTLIIKQYNNKR